MSSQEPDGRHSIAPFVLSHASSWEPVLSKVAGHPHVVRASIDGDRAHFVFRTGLLRFKDDVHLERTGTTVHVRSCSRVGYWDLGTNRRRLEGLRAQLKRLELLVS